MGGKSPRRLLIALTVLFSTCAYAYIPQKKLPSCVASTPGYTCGTAGRLGRNAPAPDAVYQNVTTVDACRIQCIQRGIYNICNSIAYNAKRKSCSLYQDSVSSLQFEAVSTSQQRFFDYQCFACIKICPPTGSENFLVNPNFDNPTTSGQNPASPWNDGTTFNDKYAGVTIANKGYNTSTSISCYQNGCNYDQAMDLCLGSLYSLTFQYRLESISSQTAHWGIGAGDWSFSNEPLPLSDINEWLPFYGSFVARIASTPYPTDSDVLLFMEVMDDQYTQVFIDNISVQPASLITPPASAVSILRNAGFESGHLTPFKADTSSNWDTVPVIVSPGHGSKYAVSCKTTAICGMVSQPLSLQRYSIYTLSLWYMKTGDQCNGDYDYGVQIQLPQSDGDFSTFFDELLFPSPTLGKWLKYSRAFQARGNITSMELVLRTGPDCQVVVDDITLTLAGSAWDHQ